MKNLRTFLFLVSLVLSVNLACQGFYDLNTINVIEIEFEEENWNEILHQLVANGLEERLTGTAIINGVAFDSVGVRYKGNSSYSPNRIKNPLNIKLDYIIDDQELDGYGTLKLSNGFKDPSMVREALGYEIARKYYPASLSNYASVYINGSNLGLFTSNQDVDKYFMQTHLGVTENARIKGEMMQGNQGVWKYLGADSSSYSGHYVLESDYGWNKLVGFLDTLNNHNNYLENVLNVDRLIWKIAYDILVVNLDAPINMAQNYYIFEDAAGRFNIIPWDLNEIFGAFNNVVGGGPLNLYQMQTLDPFFNISNANYPIINKVLNNSRRKKIFIAHTKTMLEEIFSNGWYLERALEIQSIIDVAVQNDPNKLYTYEQFLNNIYNTVGGGPPPNQMPVPGITQLMDARTQFLNNHQWFQYVNPTISDVNFSPENVTSGDEITFTAQVENAVTVELVYSFGENPVFDRTTMFDDGNHNDGAANDGIYGALITAGNTGISFYIFAENDNAASFSPARAEYETYQVPVSGNLVINEFLADNETTVTDQNGEYDDWIEFYNNGQASVNLQGYYLSDDLAEPEKWIFPDTTIQPGGFLIVWADEDLEQSGLHADFKISKSGESLVLSNPQLEVVDVVTFEQQQTDISTGRYPNGSGDFVFMIPTFGVTNGSGFIYISENEEVQVPFIEVFPNPFSENLFIHFYLEDPAGISVFLTNFKGQSEMLVDQQSFPIGNHQVKFETSNLTHGVWICHVAFTDQQKNSFYFKLVK